MTSKLGFHIDLGMHDDEDGKILAARPKIMKFVAARSAMVKMHEKLPDTIFIARIASTENVGDDFLRFGGHNNPTASAKRWFDQMLPILKEAPFAYWESFNEMSSWEHLGQYGVFEAERQHIMADNGFRCCIGNFSTGTPQITDEGDMWSHFYLALAAAHNYHNILGLHEYGGLWMDLWYDDQTAGGTFPEKYAEGWLICRYRKLLRKHIFPNGWDNVRLAFTEYGLDNAGTSVTAPLAGKPVGPYKQCGEAWGRLNGRFDRDQFYVEQLQWADRQMQQDPQVIGATIFTWGTFSPVWGEFDIEGPVAELLVEHIRTSHTPVTTYLRTVADVGQFLRTGPGYLHPGIAIIRPSMRLVEKEKGVLWTQVILPSGLEGWADSQYLEQI